MKKIIPFKKDIIFKTNLAEITSISLEHTLKINEKNVNGNFILSGEYKITDSSVNTDTFSYNLPFNINFDDKYDLENATCDLDDFYYEIINDNVLAVHIDVCVDQIKEVLIEELNVMDEPISLENIESEETKEMVEEEQRCIEDEETEKIESLFDNLDSSKETYKTYKIYIVRDGDNIESIMEKYSTSKEILEQYNNLDEIKIGDKIIIPATYETN